MTFTDPPRAPDPSGLVPIIGILCIAAGVVLIAAYCGCSEPKAPVPAYCTNETAFTARQLACVDEAARNAHDEPEFRNMTRVCRAAVHERCGITYVSSKDGGAP